MLPIVNHPDYVAQIGDDHRFPINKFGALFQLLQQDKIIRTDNLFIPEPVSHADLLNVHKSEYIEKIDNLSLSKEEERKLGFPMVPSVKRRSYMATGGTVLAARLALQYQLACNTAGGSHHAFAGAGNGYCVFNDVAVAAHSLLAQKLVRRILIYDLDVHQGDGTAEIFKNHPQVYTCSIHAKKNYPAKKQQSNQDIELEEHLQDEAYLAIVEDSLQKLSKQSFDFVFYVAGVDVHEDDKLGALRITTKGIIKENKWFCRTFINARSQCAEYWGWV